MFGIRFPDLHPIVALVVFAIAAILGLCRIQSARAQELTIDVSTDQVVSLSGRGPSLRVAIEDVCFRAGIDLLAYDAEDRAYGGSYEQLPVTVFFQRVLRSESFLVEAVTIGGTDRVTSLRVLGDPVSAAARRASGEGRRRRFQVPPSLVSVALSGKSAGEQTGREAALAILGARIAENPTELQGFLATEPKLIAQAVQRHDGAEAALRELQQRYPDPRIHQKIEQIIESLRTLPPLAGQ